ncbi:MAG TPA: hypothetical protein VNU01_11280 [Egibacteraceae bacterium]|nr:hypothetical protein [Egibacteraceae bacterium]
MSALVLFAAQATPPDSLMAKLAVPLGALIFLGSIYLLLRSNLGTRRGYLVFGAAFFGYMVIQSAFWAFGAPGTPVATGPTNLPGQVANEYQPEWVAFAEDSRLGKGDYAWIQGAEWGAVPEDFADEARVGVDDIQGFFSSDAGHKLVGENWKADTVEYAQQDGTYPVLRVTYLETDKTGAVAPGGDEVTLYGFYDAGSPSFPAVVLLLISLAGLAVHGLLLDRDEQREKRELRELRGETAAREPVAADA